MVFRIDFKLILKANEGSTVMNLITISEFFNKNLRFFQGFFIIFYLVGIAGLVLTNSQYFFIALIPWVLLLTMLVLLFFQKPSLNFKLLLVAVRLAHP